MPSQPSDAVAQHGQTTGGWISFAAVLLVLAGGLNAGYGLIVLLDNDAVVWARDSVLLVDLTAWGWAHVVVGALVALCGLGLLLGNAAAQAGAALFAAISLAVNFFFIPVYPLWSLVVITLDVLVLWAVLVPGREPKAMSSDRAPAP